MADLFHKQAKNYAETRPSYPERLFEFIASKTPNHELVWDVGTGSGQAAKSLAKLYKNVVATDTSQEQLDYAPKLPNVRYQYTPPNIPLSELESCVAPPGTVDLVTIAQALHWFDLPTFYQQVKLVLKKPHGVIAAWCYTVPEANDNVTVVNDKFDALFRQFYAESQPYWDPARKLVDGKYKGIDFPFEPVGNGANHTGPFEFTTERLMDLEGFFTYIRSWSAYQTAKDKGVELLSDDAVESFKRIWNEDGVDQKLAKLYKNVVATDTSQEQLDYAPNLPNVRYQCTPPNIPLSELESSVAPPGTVDLVTIAQALHWFDLPTFYQQVKLVLKKPHGVIAAWCYTVPEANDNIPVVSDKFDAIFRQYYADTQPYFDPARKLVDGKYKGIDFPFKPLGDGANHTGPFEFTIERLMDLESFLTYLRSWSAYQTAKDKGVELLSGDVVESFKRAWSEDGVDHKVVKSPIYLRIGKVGNSE